jgi:hypothetical protein
VAEKSRGANEMTTDNDRANPMKAERYTVKTLQVKLRPGSADWLDGAAREVNMVWNHLNEVSSKAAMPFYGPPKFLSGYDLRRLVTGAMEFLPHIGVNTATKSPWSMRSAGSKQGRDGRSAGCPSASSNAASRTARSLFRGRRFRVFDSYGLDKYEFRSGSFSQNALGEWFFNVAVREPEPTRQDLPAKAVGIDLGLRTIATVSDGQTLPKPAGGRRDCRRSWRRPSAGAQETGQAPAQEGGELPQGRTAQVLAQAGERVRRNLHR